MFSPLIERKCLLPNNFTLHLGRLSKVLKRTVCQVSEPANNHLYFGNIFLLVSTCPISFWSCDLTLEFLEVILSSLQWPHRNSTSRIIFFHSKYLILLTKSTNCPRRPTCPCTEGLWCTVIQIPKRK